MKTTTDTSKVSINVLASGARKVTALHNMPENSWKHRAMCESRGSFPNCLSPASQVALCLIAKDGMAKCESKGEVL